MTHTYTHTHAHTRRVAAAAGALIAGFLALSACSSGADTASATSASAGATTFDGADVTFAQNMVPHHQQAIDMAQMVDGRSTNAQVIDLAARIESAQQPEIDTLTGWLDDWDVDQTEDTTAMQHPGMTHGSDGAAAMGGMMSDQDMAGLNDATGTDFDRMWLQMMVVHHTGAVDMATTEIDDGQDADAIAMARDITAAQNDEIAEMDQLLQVLPTP